MTLTLTLTLTLALSPNPHPHLDPNPNLDPNPHQELPAFDSARSILRSWFGNRKGDADYTLGSPQGAGRFHVRGGGGRLTVSPDQ